MNQNLADQLVMMMREDQHLLQQLFDSGELPSESYHPRMKALHEQNASRLKELIIKPCAKYPKDQAAA